MANKRTWKKKNNIAVHTSLQQFHTSLDRVEDVIRLFYGEYQEMKKNQEKKYLLQFIRMREEMVRDMVRLKKNGIGDKEVIHYLNIYAEELADVLEDHGVEIIVCKEGEMFDSSIMKPIMRVDTDIVEANNRVAEVCSFAYRWKGMMLKKMDVAVYVYSC